MSRKANLLLRLRAALWCAAVAGALCIGVLLYRHLDLVNNAGWVLVLFSMVPAGVSGWLVGWHLLNPNGHHDPASAIGLGTAVVLLAYGVMFVIVPVVAFLSAGHRAWEALQDNEAVFALTMFFGLLFPIGAIILTGWITLPIGWIAAYLLSWRYRGRRFTGFPPQATAPDGLSNNEDQQGA